MQLPLVELTYEGDLVADRRAGELLRRFTALRRLSFGKVCSMCERVRELADSSPLQLQAPADETEAQAFFSALDELPQCEKLTINVPLANAQFPNARRRHCVLSISFVS